MANKPYRPIDRQKVFDISMQIARIIEGLDPGRPERYALQARGDGSEDLEALVTELSFPMFPRVYRWRIRNIGNLGNFKAAVWPQGKDDELRTESDPLSDGQVESFFNELYHFSRGDLDLAIQAAEKRLGSKSWHDPIVTEAIDLLNSTGAFDPPRLASV